MNDVVILLERLMENDGELLNELKISGIRDRENVRESSHREHISFSIANYNGDLLEFIICSDKSVLPSSQLNHNTVVIIPCINRNVDEISLDDFEFLQIEDMGNDKFRW